MPVGATTYFLASSSNSPAGNDGNTGTDAAHPWLSPNHALNCGDVILAAASTAYNAGNFFTGSWGTVTCAAGNNVAWLKCAVFDTCKITGTSFAGMWIDKSYWGVQGWEITTPQTDQFGQCFQTEPNFTTPVNIHHIIFANNIANGCGGAGIATAQGSNNTTGVDYVVLIGNIVYNSSSSTTGVCDSAISIAVPINTDTAPGTHDYVAGNFTWASFDGNPCNGGVPTDGEGIILDTINFFNYTGQMVVQNNIVFLNGGRGIEVYLNAALDSRIYIKYNTLYSNGTDPNQNSSVCGDLQIYTDSKIEELFNLVQEAQSTGCGSNLLYAMSVGNGGPTDHVYNNFAYGISGQNTQISTSPGFSYGPGNTLGTSPAYFNPVNPGAPSCGSFVSVPACMATVISNFTPTNATAKPYGYQPVSTTSIYDPFYPVWLCTVTNLPTGLVTPGCVTGDSLASGTAISGKTLK